MRRWLPALSWDRPVTVMTMCVALLVVGFIAWIRIPVQMMPSGFEPRFLWVYVPFRNAAPIETDELVVRPIIDQLGTVSGISNLRSFARPDQANFAIEFHSSVNMDEAYNDVIDRFERAMVDLPEEVERYWVFKFNPDDEPIAWVGVSFPESLEDPYYLMHKVVQPRLDRISGVASIDVWGVNDRVVYIDYDKERLFAHGVDLGQVQRSLAGDNFQMSGGRIVDRGVHRHVRSLANMNELDDYRQYPVRPWWVQSDQQGLVLEDVADVSLRGVRSASINRVDGEEGAVLAIKKESTANTVEVSRQIERVLRTLEQDPRMHGAEFFVFFSQGDLIIEGINNLANTAAVGGLFAVVILFAFLRDWRMTLLISLCIPFSLLITIVVLYFRGDTLNLIAMMGLMLAVGMVVDNAVVVVESIYQRRSQAITRREAAIEGTGEVNLAIMLSTATTMVVFLPVILMTEEGGFSFFMSVLGLPVVFALAASLFVALVFIPLATRFIKEGNIRENSRWMTGLSKRYAKLLRWVLRRRSDATLVLVAVIAFTVAVVMPGVQYTDDVEGNINNFTIRFTVPLNTSPAERDALVGKIEQLVEDNRELWGVRVYRSRLGDRSSRGRVYVYLDRGGSLTRQEVIDDAKSKIPTEIPGVTASIGWEGAGETGGNKLSIHLFGDDVGVLGGLAEEVSRRLRTAEGVLTAESDVINEGLDELRLHVDREAVERYGLSALSVGQTVAFAMRANQLTPVMQGEREIEVVTQLELEDRADIDTLLDFPVWSPVVSALVPLRALVHLEVARGVDSITRRNRRTSLTVTADLEEDLPLDKAMAGVKAAMADFRLPRGYSWSPGDRYEDRASDDEAMNFALLLSVTFVFLLMGMLFESFVLPLSVITTVPMAMMGAMWGLWLSGTAMDTMAGVGLVILVGVVVNNGIVLVDLVTQLRARGAATHDAIVEAGQRRLRPILMTALTTICGLLPMALGSSALVGVPYAPLGRVVIGGMTVATVLTLVFVPYLYALLDDARSGTLRWWVIIRGRVVAAEGSR